MLRTIINKNTYQDSVVLMLLTNDIAEMEGINKVSIMMGTPANKDIFKSSGFDTPDLDKASANDMVIIVDAESDEIVAKAEEEIEKFLADQSKKKEGKAQKEIRSWEGALDILADANLAVISVPGEYAASVANRALDENLNTFIFSDNVALEDELKLKEKAKERGLFLMGPDSGTGIIHGVPIAFTNHVSQGKIGIVGASGTGIQEVSSLIDRYGEGVSNAIGTGGRDLSSEIGGITMLNAIAALNSDKQTELITIISKPPAQEVREKIMNYLRKIDKPIVTIFIGEKPEEHEENLYHAYSLEEAARLSVALIKGQKIDHFKDDSLELKKENRGKNIKGYFSGGTLAEEAAMLIRDALDMEKEDVEGYLLNQEGFQIMDLGDDKYTKGKPHPMIDPSTRSDYLIHALDDKDTMVVLFDIVLGYGSHEDMAHSLAPSIEELKERAEKEGRDIYFVSSICGTDKDPQGFKKEKEILEDLGVIVCDSNNKAVDMALSLVGEKVEYIEKEVRPKKKAEKDISINVSEEMKRLMAEKPKIINIGLQNFADTLDKFDVEYVQYDWRPVAGGDIEMIKTLDFLRDFKF